MIIQHTRLIERMQDFKNISLPGINAHEVFYRQGLGDRNAALIENSNPVNGQSNIVLIKRPEYRGVHSGQMALPGGKMEVFDRDLIETALRETEEEIGVKREGLTHLRELTKVYIPPSGFLVYPHLFISRDELNVARDPHEVEAIVFLPVEELLDDRVFVRGNIELPKERMKIKTWYFDHPPYSIWGATALMLNEVKWMLKSVLHHD